MVGAVVEETTRKTSKTRICTVTNDDDTPTAVLGRVHRADHPRVYVNTRGQDLLGELVKDHPGRGLGTDQNTRNVVHSHGHVRFLRLHLVLKNVAVKSVRKNIGRGIKVKAGVGVGVGTERNVNGKGERRRYVS